jgi:hypothetical protein
MRFPSTISRLPNGLWLAVHDGPDVGKVEARGATRAEALDKLKGEIRYRLELCPCTGETYQHINVEVVETRP